jgi:hypothetical protein
LAANWQPGKDILVEVSLMKAIEKGDVNSRNTIRNISVYTWPPNTPQQVVVARTARLPTGFWRVLGINEINIRQKLADRVTAYPCEGCHCTRYVSPENLRKNT